MIIGDESHSFLVVGIQFGDVVEIGTNMILPKVVKLTIIYIELVFLYLHLNSVDHD